MARVTVYHLTHPRRLPLIEEEGLRTRADLSKALGPLGEIDMAAPGRFAHGKRVSAFLSLDHAKAQTADLGEGLVSFTVDPSKTLAVPTAAGRDDAAAYWAAAKSLAAWQSDGDVPDDLEVHVFTGVRDKHVTLHAPLVTDERLGVYAPLVAAAADSDRLGSKAMMHLALIGSNSDFDSAEYLAATAFAWRDNTDDDAIMAELMRSDADAVAEATLSQYEEAAPEGVAALRKVLEQTRTFGDENGLEPAQAIYTRTAVVLDNVGEGAAGR